MTATERGDEDYDDINMNDDFNNNGNMDLNNQPNMENNNSNTENDLNNSESKSKNISKNNTNNGNQKSLMDKLLFKKDSAESLRNFKIPRQAKKEMDQVDKSISPGLLSNSSSNSNSSAFETNISRANFAKNGRNSSCDSANNLNEYSSSSSNSPLLNPPQSELNSSNSNLNSSKSYSNYYHPKKNQFRQYMMENSSVPTKHHSDGYFNHETTNSVLFK